MREFEPKTNTSESASASVDAQSESSDGRRRTYHLLTGVAVLLAVIGSPLFMRGITEFIIATSSSASSSPSVLRSAGLLVISVSPLALAAFTWHRALSLERLLEDEDIQKYKRY